MKTYHVFRQANLDIFDAVKAGFSWPAFLVTLPWMLVKRLWRHAALYVIACIVVSRVTAAAEIEASELLDWACLAGIAALLLVPGFMGNKWLAADLKRRHFEPLEKLQARSRGAAVAEAESRFGGGFLDIFATTDRAELMVVKATLDAENLPYKTRGETSGLVTGPVVIAVSLRDKDKALNLLQTNPGKEDEGP